MKRKKVLIVDDEKDTCDLLSRHFQKRGWDSKEVYNGIEALDFLEKDKPDLIILDVLMPKMDGFEVLQRLKTSSHYAAIPVIMLTAKREAQNLDKGISLGAEFYLPKPFQLDNLFDFIELTVDSNQV